MTLRRLKPEYFTENKLNMATARLQFYGKPFMMEIMSKDIVRYNAHVISRRLAMKGGKYATAMRKLIESAIANGLQKGLNHDNMFIKSLSVGRGSYLKRRECKSRGRSAPIWRPYSNVLLELQEVDLE